MNGSQHYTAGERLLSDASFSGENGYPVRRDGTVFEPGEYAALISRAQAHATLALAAAQALPLVVQMMSDCDEVTRWAYAIGWIDEPKTAPATRTAAEAGPVPLGMATWPSLIDSRVTVTYLDGRTDTGRLTEVDDDSITVDVDGADGYWSVAVLAVRSVVPEERGHSADHD